MSCHVQCFHWPTYVRTYVQKENDNEDNSGKDRIALKEKVILQTNNYTRQMLSIAWML